MGAKDKSGSLLIITEDPHITINHESFTTNTVTNFFLNLSDKFDTITLSAPTQKRSEHAQTFPQKLVLHDKIKLKPRRFFFSKNDAISNPIIYLSNSISLIFNYLTADYILYRLPSPFLPLIFLLSFIRNKKLLLYIAGDFAGRNTGPNQVAKNSKLKQLIVMFYDKIEKASSDRFNCIATGLYLANKYNAEIYFTNTLPQQKLENKIVPIASKFEINILYVGRIDTNKGITFLLQALEILKREEPIKGKSFKLVIVGHGAHKPQIEREVKSRNIEADVTFTGSLSYGPELFSYFHQSDIFVLPSLSEGIPKVLLEAMTFGLPIVATNVGGVKWLLEDAGMIVPPRDPVAIAQKIKLIVNNNQLHDQLVERGYKIAKRYSKENRLKTLYQHIKST